MQTPGERLGACQPLGTGGSSRALTVLDFQLIARLLESGQQQCCRVMEACGVTQTW